jgi:hypothetical protein
MRIMYRITLDFTAVGGKNIAGIAKVSQKETTRVPERFPCGPVG